MSKRVLPYIFIFVIFLVSILAGCTSTSGEPNNSPNELANPASVYCQGLGFTEETRENEAGQYSVCIFPDGSECDTWDFLAGRCGQEHSYCVEQGYEIKSIENSNIAECTFEDGSTCSEYLFYEGECKPGDNLP